MFISVTLRIHRRVSATKVVKHIVGGTWVGREVPDSLAA
jgi:hypothetical protein